VSWPTLQDYNEAIQEPHICFEDSQLRSGTIECNQLGLPRPRSGNFATVYKMESAAKRWAVKCFSAQMLDQQERYAAIHTYLRQVSLPYVVDFTFLSRGILVRGQWHPIVKMEWAEGETLNAWIARNVQNAPALIAFSKSFVSMLSALQQSHIAHGDLQHGNILVVNSEPKLVDYDGMYVPALSGKLSNEIGQPNYQHPHRTALDFGPNLDNFSGWVILLSLVALSLDPKLWTMFKGGDDCLLFRKRDFEDPHNSPLVKALESESNPELRQAVALFRTVMACPPQSVPTIDGTFSLPSSAPAVQVQTGGAGWIQDHLPVNSPRPASASVPNPTLDWLLDSTHPAGPPIQFVEGVGVLRGIAYLTIALVILAVQLSLRMNVPALMISLPFVLGSNLLIWRARYRSDPAVAERESVLLKRRELQERLRVMHERIEEIEADKQRVNRQVSDHKSKAAKEELELSSSEQKTNNSNDAKLQSAISTSIHGKQKLDGQETTELSALQNTLGKALSSLTQSLASLGQSESRDLSNTLRAQQVAFVQGQLQKAWLATAQIQGIGAGYKNRLQAARIFTAADIDYRIDSVKGIGVQRAATLRTWRNALEFAAKSKMPMTLTWQDENSIKSKYTAQKATLESQINQSQQELRTREASIRTKYAGLKMPFEGVLVAERQKHEAERNRISSEFKQKRQALGAKIREVEDGAVRVSLKLDSKQHAVRKEMFNLQWRMTKVDRELARFSRISFRSYIKRVLVFS
jgi:serine/threonine protein kinase